jgi:hypothetical protein
MFGNVSPLNNGISIKDFNVDIMVLAASMFVNLKLYSLIEINFSKIINKSL